MNVYIDTSGTSLKHTHNARMREVGTENFYGIALKKVKIQEDKLLLSLLDSLKPEK